ncbi:MAG: hypothetical protein FJ214_02090 [Ignavibacteria bacterium]|nr:hypothetical protein [Ignavibacteria bacterium]
MLLETLDLRTNDVLIYSQNLFNFNESFKIIYKNEKIRRPHRISYFDVCNIVKEPTAKNLIIYRLLTNVNSLDAYSTKYGYFININGKMELIYFDPIFAIKDLRHLRFDLDPSRFRFKIQQVGLTSLTRWEGEPNFAEVYNFDLKAVEAQNQNDKIFADAIFAFDNNFIDEELEKEKNQKQVKKSSLKETVIDPVANLKNIAEDSSTQSTQLNLPKTPNSEQIKDLREEIISLLKQALNIPDEQKTDKIKSTQVEFDENGNHDQVKSVFDLFKSTTKSDGLTEREKDSVILKFNK